jgi:hypothetical protein
VANPLLGKDFSDASCLTRFFTVAHFLLHSELMEKPMTKGTISQSQKVRFAPNRVGLNLQSEWLLRH